MPTSDRWPDGYVKVWFPDANCTILPRVAYDEFTTAMAAGKPFWQGPDAYGDDVMIRLATVSMVCEITQAGLRGFEAEEQARKMEDMTSGD